MIDKALCLKSIAQALRDLGYGVEIHNLGKHDWISVSWKGHELSNLNLEDCFQFPDTRTPGSKELVTELILEVQELTLTMSVRIFPDGAVQFENLLELLEDVRERAD